MIERLVDAIGNALIIGFCLGAIIGALWLLVTFPLTVLAVVIVAVLIGIFTRILE